MIIFKTPSYKCKDKFWQAFIELIDNAYYTGTQFWHTKNDGTDSIHQTSALTLVTIKNEGKSNETTPLQQAHRDVEGLIKVVENKGYSLTGEVSSIPSPMLAMTYSKPLVGSYYVQPKLDGVRVITNGKNHYSRNGKEIPSQILEHISLPTLDYYLDGELILPSPYSFQDTVSAIKKYKETTSKLVYHIFDVINVKDTFTDRYSYLQKELVESTHLRLVETTLVSELETSHQKFMLEGYEGTIIRVPDSLYEVGKRSKNLLKYKDFLDADFKVVNVIEGVAKEVGCAIFDCTTTEGLVFTCRPLGSVKDRQEMFQNKEKLIGQTLIVKYQNLTDKGVPRFPVGIGFRYEDT